MTQLGQVQISATTLPEVVVQLNTILGRLQQGAVICRGLKLDTTRTSAPTAAPGAGDPNLVVVNVAGTVKVYIYDVATGWVVCGTQV